MRDEREFAPERGWEGRVWKKRENTREETRGSEEERLGLGLGRGQ